MPFYLELALSITVVKKYNCLNTTHLRSFTSVFSRVSNICLTEQIHSSFGLCLTSFWATGLLFYSVRLPKAAGDTQNPARTHLDAPDR